MTSTVPISGAPTFAQYYVNEYRWINGTTGDDGLVEYYYNYGYKANSTSSVPYQGLYLFFAVYQKNSIICDWIMVTNYVEEEYQILFSDDFNDNLIDNTKWTEIFDDGDWNETNQRTEFLVYEGTGESRSEG